MPLPSIQKNASRKERQACVSDSIKELIKSYDDSGKLGNSRPANRKEALKQATAIAMDHCGLARANMTALPIPLPENMAFFDGELSEAFEVQVPGVPDNSLIRVGKIAEAGEFADKGITLTADDLKAAAADFVPVDADLEHRRSMLDNNLGTLLAVTPSEDGTELIGVFSEPAWMAGVIGDVERKVSLAWDKATKRIAGIAHVLNPRIADAALMAAFSAAENKDDDKPKEKAMAENKNDKPKGFKAGLAALFAEATPEELASLDAIFAESKPVPVKTPREKELEDRIAKFEQDAATAARAAVQAQAVAFADGLVTAGKIAAKGNEQYNAAIALFSIAAEFDARKPQLACFSDEGAAKKFGAVAEVTALLKQLPDLKLDGEKAGSADKETAKLIAAFEQEVTTVNGKAADQAVDWAEVNKSRAERGLKPVEVK